MATRLPSPRGGEAKEVSVSSLWMGSFGSLSLTQDDFFPPSLVDDFFLSS